MKATARWRGVAGDESNRVFLDDGKSSKKRVGLVKEMIGKWRMGRMERCEPREKKRN